MERKTKLIEMSTQQVLRFSFKHISFGVGTILRVPSDFSTIYDEVWTNPQIGQKRSV